MSDAILVNWDDQDGRWKVFAAHGDTQLSCAEGSYLIEVCFLREICGEVDSEEKNLVNSPYSFICEDKVGYTSDRVISRLYIFDGLKLIFHASFDFPMSRRSVSRSKETWAGSLYSG